MYIITVADRDNRTVIIVMLKVACKLSFFLQQQHEMDITLSPDIKTDLLSHTLVR